MGRDWDRDWIASRLASAAASQRTGLPGDHALNPGTKPKKPLVAAAVLIPIVNHKNGGGHKDGLTLLFTQRTERLTTHAGQISFPGGHMEPGDGAPEETALRECEEETGISRRDMTVLGRLGDYRTRTGFLVTPVVGLVEPPLKLNPDPVEVADVFEAPLDFFLDPANHQLRHREFEGKMRKFYAMPYGDRYIWGATAGILFNLYDSLVQP